MLNAKFAFDAFDDRMVTGILNVRLSTLLRDVIGLGTCIIPLLSGGMFAEPALGEFLTKVLLDFTLSLTCLVVFFIVVSYKLRI